MPSPLLPTPTTAITTLPAPIVVAARDAAVGRMMAMALRLEGYEPHIYTDGKQAQDALLAKPYAAAVLDVHLPTVDGLTICERVRASGSSVSAVPIILLLLEEDVAIGQAHRQDLRITAALFIPFQLRDLITAVTAAIEGGVSSVLDEED